MAIALAGAVGAQTGASLDEAVQNAMDETSLDAIWQVGTPFDGVDAAWQAPNRARDMRTFFLESGVRVQPRAGTGAEWVLGLDLDRLARGEQSIEVEAVEPVARGSRVEYHRAGLVEWYVNRSQGLEQGFEVQVAPLALGVGALELRFEVRGTLALEHVERGFVRLADRAGESAISMSQLHACDAHGNVLTCSFERRGEGLAIVVDDRGAAYPISIDPLIVNEQARLDPTMPVAGMGFSRSVDIHGDRAIVGAPDAGGGVAYLFKRVAGSWELATKLSSASIEYGDEFGWDVAIFGNRVAIGSPEAGDAGVTYVFLENANGQWLQQEILYPSNPEFGDRFGHAVSMTAQWVFVGAPREDSTAFNSGAVHTFVVQGTQCVPGQRLIPTNAEVNDRFGSAVDADETGGYLVVGAPGIVGTSLGGAVHVFVNGTGFFIAGPVLTSTRTTNLGYSVAVDGDAIVSGSPFSIVQGSQRGIVEYFTGSGMNWVSEGAFFGFTDGERSGVSVDLDRSAGPLRLLIGAPRDDSDAADAGCVHVLEEFPTGGYIYRQRLTDSPPRAGAAFGTSVALLGDTALVGTPADEVEGVESGSARLFDLVGGAWQSSDKWTGNALEFLAGFGNAVAMHGDLAVVGASKADEPMYNAGAAFVFERLGAVWVQTARLSAGSFANASGRFGSAVATDGERIAVGSTGGADGMGQAFVFERFGEDWVMAAELVRSDPTGNAFYGESIDIQGGICVVGAFQQDAPDGPFGAAYVFHKEGPAWLEDIKLFDTLSGLDSNFGESVAVDGGTIVVSAPRFDDGIHPRGAVFEYMWDGSDWVYANLLQSNVSTDTFFGYALAFKGGRLAVGAPFGALGSVHVYTWGSGGFVPEDTIIRPDANFGSQTSIDGGILAVAANDRAFTFSRVGSLWEEVEVVATDGPFNNERVPVAVSGSSVLVGYLRGHAATEYMGGAYIFDVPAPGLIQAYGVGDGSYAACPCGNESTVGSGQGCANSTGSGGQLTYQGTSDLFADDLRIDALSLPPGVPAQLFAGESRRLGAPFGDGLRLVGTPFIRVGSPKHASAGGEIVWDDLRIASRWASGDTRYFQALYRDSAGPCGDGFNTTSGLQVIFSPLP